MRASIKRDKIQEALELLNEAAQEKREEVYEILGNKYEYLKDVFETATENGQEMAGHARKQIIKGLHAEEKKVRDAAAQWDKKVHKDPWVFISSVALGSLVLGIILGRKN